MTKKKTKKKTANKAATGRIVSTNELAEMFGWDGKVIRNRRDAGIIQEVSRARYDLVSAVRSLVEYERDSTQPDDLRLARIEEIKARTKKVDLINARLNQQYLDRPQVLSAWSMVLAGHKVQLERIGEDLGPTMAMETEAKNCERKLTEWIRERLEGLSVLTIDNYDPEGSFVDPEADAGSKGQ